MACDHEGCRCTETIVEEVGKNYCGENCAQLDAANGAAPRACLCGHPDCAAL